MTGTPYLFIYFIFVTLGGGSEKILLQFMSENSQLMFSSKSFRASGLTFRSLIHFEFIFVYDVRECPNFILSHVVVQFSQAPVFDNYLRVFNLFSAISIRNFLYSVSTTKIRIKLKKALCCNDCYICILNIKE